VLVVVGIHGKAKVAASAETPSAPSAHAWRPGCCVHGSTGALEKANRPGQ
jgi:hypothetical protein